MVKVLLHFPHGLGDVVQLSVVLKHLRQHRTDWVIDVRCGRGKHTALIGLCNKVWHDQEPEPSGPYDAVAQLGWYENYCRYEDRPNSKITNCLAEVFGLNYDPLLGRYEIQISDDSRKKAQRYYNEIKAEAIGFFKFRVVVLHYEGNTSTWKKNLKHWQARVLCDRILRMGRIPVLLDWDNRSPLPDQRRIFCPKVNRDDLWGGFGSGDAQVIAALIEGAEAYIGIDSGPGKCASATNTPSLIVWKEHHPIQFHDPAANTTHLIIHDWRFLPPCERRGVQDYFERHYRFRTYRDEHSMIDAATNWLRGSLQDSVALEKPGMGKIYLSPNGIGDVLWVLHKLRSISKGEPVDMVLSGNPGRDVDWRAVPFLERFPSLVRSVTVLDAPVLQSEDDGRKNDEKGRYNYWQDGERGGMHYLIPNAVLERGERLETWLPEHPIDWDVVNEFNWKGTEKGDALGRSLQPFAAFYLGPETGNADEGHNRGFLWEPKHWVQLGKMLMTAGLRIVVVGAHYDHSFWDVYVREGVKQAGMRWHDYIGKLEIGDTMAMLRHARVFVSYQCGLGIFAHYLGVRVAMWWRPDQDSIHPRRMVSFDERMKDAWVNPKYQDRYMGLVYKKCDPESIFALMKTKGWLDN